MKCEIFDLLRHGGKVELRDCQAEGTHSVSTDDDPRVWHFCPKHYAALVDVLKERLNGGGTYKQERAAKRFFEKHPEAGL